MEKGLMKEAVFCKVCKQVYQKGARDPLVMQCGHTFCRSCVSASKQGYDIVCPTCKKPHSRFCMRDLPVLQTLLDLSTTFMQSQYGVCSKHEDQLKSSWCSKCNVAVCAACRNTKLHKGHKIQLAQDYVQQKRVKLRENITETYKNLIITRYQNKRILGKIAQYEHQKYVNSFEKLQQLTKDTETAYSIDSVTNHETELNQMNDLLSTEAEHNKFKDFHNKASEEVKASEKANIEALQSKLYIDIHNPWNLADIPKAKLVFKDDRLVVRSCIPKRVDQRPNQMTTVFLELSVGSKCLSRVYIKLCNDKDMAELFLSKCLGTLSASFPWKSLSMLSKAEKDIEYLAFSHRIKRSVPDWNKASSEGLGMGTDTESKIKGTVAVVETETKVYQFCILIKCASKVRRESFGRVSSGLKVVRDAIRQDPKSQITITNCGLVVDDFGIKGDDLYHKPPSVTSQ